MRLSWQDDRRRWLVTFSQGTFISQAELRAVHVMESRVTCFSSHLSSRGFLHSEKANVKLAQDFDFSAQAETETGKMHACLESQKEKEREDKERKIKARSRAEFSKALSSQQIFLFSRQWWKKQGLDYSQQKLSFFGNLPPPLPCLQ